MKLCNKNYGMAEASSSAMTPSGKKLPSFPWQMTPSQCCAVSGLPYHYLMLTCLLLNVNQG